MSTSRSLNIRKEPVSGFGAVVISESGFPLGRRSIKAVVIWSYMVHYIANCISKLDFLRRWRIAWSTLTSALIAHSAYTVCTACVVVTMRAYGLSLWWDIINPHGGVGSLSCRRCWNSWRTVYRGKADQPFWAGGQRVQAAGFILQDEVLAIVC